MAKGGKKAAQAKAGKKAAKNRWKHAIPLAAATVPTVATAITSIQSGQGVKGVVINGVYQLTGYNVITGKWTMPGSGDEAGRNGLIAAGGMAIGWGGRKLKLNKYIPLPAGWKVF